MLLARLTLVDLRNYEALSFEPPEGLSLLVGPNGQGKSNLLEAIALLATAKSFRTSHERELIRDGCERATVAGDVVLQAGVVRLGCTIARNGAGTRKTYAVNGKGVRFASYLGNARVVTFVPADLDLAGGAPAARVLQSFHPRLQPRPVPTWPALSSAAAHAVPSHIAQPAPWLESRARCRLAT